jgi:hypothetical protein
MKNPFAEESALANLPATARSLNQNPGAMFATLTTGQPGENHPT